MKPVLIVAHGQPSDPDRAEAEVADLGARVAAHLPGRQVLTATLAQKGRLADALFQAGTTSGGLVFPLFMAGGWFTRAHLPAQIAAAGGQGWQVLEPLGCDPGLHQLAVDQIVRSGAKGAVLAAHGSGRSRAPGMLAQHLASRIARETGTPTRAAFIEQEPKLQDLPDLGPDTVCLPYFALAGEHVTEDLPRALAQAGFDGRILPAIGLEAGIPALIAKAITRAVPVCTADCRFAPT